ncbi:hypothetical protein AWB79_05958 [Caballeronia hypogeia]|uniref:Uncharacterized protein n=1 Tax=Caballeronia hypogeia TaxID=1777140 RepID=A0A158CTN3_9BURK|nr:hypothetical protein AWB79_05958 [Caballeronia hypogeia]
MRFADIFKRPKKGDAPARSDAGPHHEEHAKSVQKQAKTVWDAIGRRRHKDAKWH